MTIFMGLFDHFPKKGCTPRRRVLPYSEQYQLKTEEPQEITLIPYGCSTLRITEFPIVQARK